MNIVVYKSFKNLQFEAWRTMIQNVILFYFIFNIILIKYYFHKGCPKQNLPTFNTLKKIENVIEF